MKINEINILHYFLFSLLLLCSSFLIGILTNEFLKMIFMMLSFISMGYVIKFKQCKIQALVLSIFLIIYIVFLQLTSVYLNHNSYFTSSLLFLFKILLCLYFVFSFFYGRLFRVEDDFNLNGRFFILLLLFFIVINIVVLKNMAVLSAVNSGTRDIGANPIGFAYITSITCLISVFFLKISANKSIILLSLILFLICQTNLLLSQSRGPFLFCLISSFTFLYLTKSLKLYKIYNIIGWCLFSIILLYFAKNLLSDDISILRYRFINMFERLIVLSDFFLSENSDQAIDERMYYINFYLDNFFNSFPFGIENYYYNPHNFVLEIIARFGIGSLPIFFVHVFTLMKSAAIFKYFVYRNESAIKPAHCLLLLVFCIYIFSILQSMTSLYFEINRFLWISSGFILGVNLKKLI